MCIFNGYKWSHALNLIATSLIHSAVFLKIYICCCVYRYLVVSKHSIAFHRGVHHVLDNQSPSYGQLDCL